MEKYQPYILIVIALVMPVVYTLFNYDGRGGLPAYRWGLFFVSIISYLILCIVFLGAALSLIVVLNNPKKNWREILDSSTRLTIVMLIVVLPNMFNDKQRFGWDENDLKKTINVNIGGKSFVVPVKHLVRTDSGGESTHHLGLIAVLPNFEGRSIDMKEEFNSNKNGIGRRIMIDLKVKESFGFMGKFGDLSNKALYLQYHKSRYKIIDDNKSALNLYGLNYFGEQGNKELYVSSKNNDLTYYECYKDPENGRDYTPSCETEFPLWGNVVMRYRLNKNNLKDWEEIHNGVFRFIGRMEIGPEIMSEANQNLHTN